MISKPENKSRKITKLIASVIIPTYNRSKSLASALQSLNELDFPCDQWEIVVVDNNSNDDTPQVVEAARSTGLNIKYVREERLSFTVARHTGAGAADGEILLYIDDDVTVEKGWMRTVVETFQKDTKVGMVGGPIKPIFEAEPPEWVMKMPAMWLSLFDCGNETKEVLGVPGPNLCIRKSVLDEVGGFPPDTIGVEAEGKYGTIEKIYIGSGDWGLSQKVRATGYKICYVSQAMVYHHIPPIRLTKHWWHSRLRGEGCCLAVTRQHECHEGTAKLLLRSFWSMVLSIKTTMFKAVAFMERTHTEPYEFKISFYRSRSKVEYALAKQPDLADRLWTIALTGVLPDDCTELMQLIP